MHNRTLHQLALALIALVLTAASTAAPFLFVSATKPGDGTIQTINGHLYVIDLANGQTVRAPIVVEPLPAAVIAAKTNDRVYVVNQHNYGIGSVSVISMAAAAVVATIPVGEAPKAMVIAPDDRTGYVLNSRYNSISVVDLMRDEVTREIDVGGLSKALAMSKDGRTVYVPNGSTFVEIDTATLQFRTRLAYGDAANLLPSPDGKLLYIVNTVVGGGGSFGELMYPANTVSVFDLASGAVVARIPVGAQPFAMAISPDGAFLYVSNTGDNTISVIQTSSRQEVRRFPAVARDLLISIDGARLFATNSNYQYSVFVYGVAHGTYDGPALSFPGVIPYGMAVRDHLVPGAVGPLAPIVEFHHADLDHYFITQDSLEIARLDSGAIRGWRRTGESFNAFVPGAATATTTTPVCRFYGLPAAGIDSHFYSASISECDHVEQTYPTRWVKESASVFNLAAPDPLLGQCPIGTLPVYRLWNNRSDSNHRYTTSDATRAAMTAKGYVAEGVVMCSPPPQTN